jgi:hypothetical protein
MVRSRARGVNSKIKQRIWQWEKGRFRYETVFIHTHQDLPIWTLFKNYFNKLEVNQEFTRVDLLSGIYVPDTAIAIRKCQTTVDQYRRAVALALCMERIGWGKYKKLKDIPTNLTISALKKFVYGSSWKRWFIPIENLKDI